MNVAEEVDMSAAGLYKTEFQPDLSAEIDFRRILVMVDFSVGSRAALHRAICLARQNGGELFLMHLEQPPMYSPDIELGATLITITSQATQELMNELVSNEPELAEVKHHEIIIPYLMDDAVHQAIRDRHIDVIAVGSHGAGGFEKLALGSVAEKIIRTCDRPVMVVGPHSASWSGQVRSVLLAVDLEPGSAWAAERALALARRLGAALTLIHVAPAGANGEPWELIRERVEAQLWRLLPRQPRLKHEPDVRMAFGDAAEEILKAASATGADLIMFGIRPKPPLADHAPWSTLSRVLRGARCPVLTVRDRR